MPFHHQQRQLEALARRIRVELSSNGHMMTEQVQRWLNRLAKLVATLRGRMTQATLKTALGSLAVFFGLGATAQSFAPMGNNPFGLVTPATYPPTGVQFVDLDGDGDLDMVGRDSFYAYDSYAYYPSIQFHENTGTANNPQYISAQFNPFGGLNGVEGWDYGYTYGGLGMDFADLDGDGDLDLIAVERYGYFYSYNPYAYGYYNNLILFAENTGTPTNPSFGDFEIQPFGLKLPEPSLDGDMATYAFDFADVDGDGDLDMVGSVVDFADYIGQEPPRGIFWCENQGNIFNPSFAAPVMAAMGLPGLNEGPASEGLSFGLQLVDVDLDGDLDLMETIYLGYSSSDYLTELRYHENTGTLTTPIFADHVVSPFGLELGPASGVLMGQFADIDGDGDPDAFFHDFLEAADIADDYPLLFQENLALSLDVANEAWELKDETRLFPNPLHPGERLQIASSLDWQQATVIDAMGRVVRVIARTPGATELDMYELHSGAYTLRLETADGNATSARFVVSP